MSTTTEEYWGIIDPTTGNEVPIQTYAYGIETWGGDRHSLPPMRGSNVVVPWVPGQAQVSKMPDQRTISMNMWVIGANEDGWVGDDERQIFNTNYMMLRRLFWNLGEPFTLIKRFYDESGVLRRVTGTAEFGSGFQPTMNGRTRASFSVDLLMADPFFYGEPETITFDTSVSGSAAWKGYVLGDYYSRRVSIVATAGASGVLNPSVAVPSNVQLGSFQINTQVSASASIQVDVPTQLAKIGGVLASPVVSHIGARDWILINPGPAEVDFDRGDGDWSGTLTYIPTYV